MKTTKIQKIKANIYSQINSNQTLEERKLEMIQGGNYPASITDCEAIGINGDCNKECFLYNKIKECTYDENN